MQFIPLANLAFPHAILRHFALFSSLSTFAACGCAFCHTHGRYFLAFLTPALYLSLLLSIFFFARVHLRGWYGVCQPADFPLGGCILANALPARGIETPLAVSIANLRRQKVMMLLIRALFYTGCCIVAAGLLSLYLHQVYRVPFTPAFRATHRSPPPSGSLGVIRLVRPGASLGTSVPEFVRRPPAG